MYLYKLLYIFVDIWRMSSTLQCYILAQDKIRCEKASDQWIWMHTIL